MVITSPYNRKRPILSPQFETSPYNRKRSSLSPQFETGDRRVVWVKFEVRGDHLLYKIPVESDDESMPTHVRLPTDASWLILRNLDLEGVESLREPYLEIVTRQQETIRELKLALAEKDVEYDKAEESRRLTNVLDIRREAEQERALWEPKLELERMRCFEMMDQVNKLEQELAGKAIMILQLEEKYKLQIDELTAKTREHVSQLAAEKQEGTRLKSAIERELYSESERRKKHVTELELKVYDLQQTSAIMEERFKNQLAENDRLVQHHSELHKSLQSHSKDVSESLNKKIASQVRTMELQAKQIVELKRELSDLKRQCDINSVSSPSVASRVPNSLDTSTELTTDNRALRGRIEELESQVLNRNNRESAAMRELEDTVHSLKSENQTWRKKYDELHRQLLDQQQEYKMRLSQIQAPLSVPSTTRDSSFMSNSYDVQAIEQLKRSMEYDMDIHIRSASDTESVTDVTADYHNIQSPNLNQTGVGSESRSSAHNSRAGSQEYHSERKSLSGSSSASHTSYEWRENAPQPYPGVYVISNENPVYSTSQTPVYTTYGQIPIQYPAVANAVAYTVGPAVASLPHTRDWY